MQEARAPVATCLRLSPKVRRIGAPTHEEGCRHVFEHRYLEAVTTVAYFTLISQGQAAWYWKLLAWGEGKEPPSGLGEQPFPHRDSSVTLTLPVHPCCSFGPDSPISSQSWFLLILFDSAQTSPSLSTLSRGRGLLLWFCPTTTFLSSDTYRAAVHRNCCLTLPRKCQLRKQKPYFH